MPARRRRPPAAKAPLRNRGRAEGSVWRRVVSQVVSRDRGLCWICGHTGAASADHVIPVTERPDLDLAAANLKAAHGYLKTGGGECPACSAAASVKAGKDVKVFCNELKGGLSVERARKIIETRTGLALGVTEDQARGERSWD
ncbi:MAG TPA: hypothetical protein VGG75_13825 [Trebonia sp.]